MEINVFRIDSTLVQVINVFWLDKESLSLTNCRTCIALTEQNKSSF